MPSSLAAVDRLGNVVATVAEGGAQEPGPVRGHLVIIRHRDVSDADRGDHDHGAEAARLRLDQRDEPLVAHEEPRLAGDALGADREQRSGNVTPADDAAGDRGVDAVIVLGREIGDEVGAPLEPRRDLLRRRATPRDRRGSPWPGSACRRWRDRTRPRCRRPVTRSRRGSVGDRARAASQATGEELVEAGVVAERLLRLADVDPVDAREARQHRLCAAGSGCPVGLPTRWPPTRRVWERCATSSVWPGR